MHNPVTTGSNSHCYNHCHNNNHCYNHHHNNNHRYNHYHKLQPQSLDPPTNSKSKNLNKINNNKKTQNLQQNSNPTDQSMTKLNHPSTARAVEDDEQRSATALGEQSFRLVSRGSDWQASIDKLCFRSESPSSS